MALSRRVTYFDPINSFSTEVTPQAYHYSVAKCSVELYSLVPITSTGWNHHTYFFVKKGVKPWNILPKNFYFFEHSLAWMPPTTIVLTSSQIVSVVMYSRYPPILHFLFAPFTFISHITFSNTSSLSGSWVMYLANFSEKKEEYKKYFFLSQRLRSSYVNSEIGNNLFFEYPVLMWQLLYWLSYRNLRLQNPESNHKIILHFLWNPVAVIFVYVQIFYLKYCIHVPPGSHASGNFSS